jgi:hypothetical protein
VREGGRSDSSRDDQGASAAVGPRSRQAGATASTSVLTVPPPAPAAPTPASARRTCRSWSAAFALASIALMPAQLRAASSPARPRAMLASSAQRSKPARRPVAPAARSVSGTPSTTTTVASAPEPAAAASRPATTSSPRPANQTQQLPRSRVGSLAAHVRLGAPALSARRKYLPTGGSRDSLRPAGRRERSSARDVLLAEGHLPLPRAMRACRQPHEPRPLWTSLGRLGERCRDARLARQKRSPAHTVLTLS